MQAGQLRLDEPVRLLDGATATVVALWTLPGVGLTAGTLTAAQYSASYDAAGNTACRAATAATTFVGATPTGALLTYDSEGRLTAWQIIALVTTSPTSTPALEEALYDGEGQRVQQIDASNTTQHTYVGGTEDLASQWAYSKMQKAWTGNR